MSAAPDSPQQARTAARQGEGIPATSPETPPVPTPAASHTAAFVAPMAWVNGAWAHDVLLTVAPDGRWQSVQANAPAEAQRGATRLGGAVVPGLVNAHSHAFQRVIVGLTERAGPTADDFWSWRERMYSAARRITPEQLEAVAAWLYAELLAGGYTQVCEFHYLHNDVDGSPYADPMEMSMALVRAAQRVGMGLTLLPTLYMHAGFGAQTLRSEQRRFASTPDTVLALADAVNALGDPRVRAGVALHSLRAVDAGALREVADATAEWRVPVHIHIAEQTQEVADCLAHTGQRPVEWLLQHAAPDARWNLVHATHTTPAELQGVRDAGAAIVICPSTEANLGDGVFDLPALLQAQGAWSIGSDSHVARSWVEELRLLEYSQRLALRQRNVAARHSGGRLAAAAGELSTAAVLLDGAVAGGSAAAGLPLAGIAVGQRADFAVVCPRAPALLGVPPAHLLDALVFSSPQAHWGEVFVAGVPRVVAGRHADADALGNHFARAMRHIWG